MRAGVNSVAGSADCSSDSAVVIVLIQADPRDGARVSARRISHRDRSRRGICVQHAARLHLVPVVIFGVDPEHRDRGNAVFGPHAFGELQGRQGFEKGEQRPAKQPRLLSCDDRDRRGIDQLRGCCTRFGWCVASLLLREQDIGYEASLSPMTRCARDGITPRTGIAGVAGIEISQPREVECVVGCEPPDPREATDIDRKTTARGRVPPRWRRGGRGGQTSHGLCPSIPRQSPSLVLQCLFGALRAPRTAMRFRRNEHKILERSRMAAQ